MTYYAIKDKETGKWVSKENGRYILTEYLDRYSCFVYENNAIDVKNSALKYMNTTNLVIVPVKLREIVDDPQEQVKEQKPKAKMFELTDSCMVKLDEIEGARIIKLITERCVLKVYTTSEMGTIEEIMTKEEAYAKYNELKKLLDEV